MYFAEHGRGQASKEEKDYLKKCFALTKEKLKKQRLLTKEEKKYLQKCFDQSNV